MTSSFGVSPALWMLGSLVSMSNDTSFLDLWEVFDYSTFGVGELLPPRHVANDLLTWSLLEMLHSVNTSNLEIFPTLKQFFVL